MLNRPSWIKKPLSAYHPWLLKLIIFIRRFERHLTWQFSKHPFANKCMKSDLPHRIKKHQSVLVRKLDSVNMQLQYNKIDNLKIVTNQLDGILIQPGEIFSFHKLVGKPTKKRGFKHGIELSRGEARPGIGGGICQSSNLIYWLALHSPLDIIERHHHSFDPFPDQGRILPFASGATVMYNYRDLQLKNNTGQTFQLKLWLDKKCLNGDLRCSEFLQYSYSVYEENHRFSEKNGQYFRSNELWRRKIDKAAGGITVDHEFIVKNFADVKYKPNKEKLNSTSSVGNN